MGRYRSGWIGALLLWASLPAAAQTQLVVDTGWGGVVRPGRWNPIVITVSDPKPRQADLEIYAPHDASFALRIHQRIVLNARPRQFAVFAPLTDISYSDAAVTLRDEQGRKLKDAMLNPQADPDTPAQAAPAVLRYGTLVGVSGQSGTMRLLEGSIGVDTSNYGQGVKIGYLSEGLLPDTPIGYDALDVLVLNQPASISPAAQAAIVEWVKAGGRLLLWTMGPVDETGALYKALPCDMGEVRVIQVPADRIAAAGLPARFGRMKQRVLKPRPGASQLSLFGDANAVYGRCGLGQVAVLSIEADLLQFDAQNKGKEFWQPIFSEGLQRALEANTAGDFDSRRAAATSQVMDRLGEIKGVGRFDFTYPAIVLVGMMVLVGPVDWLVLRKLGRPAWTWVTTTGWIALITLGGLYIGHALKSGDLHYRTLRLVDQADGKTVATVDMAMIYSPRTDYYTLRNQPGSWWEPASANTYYYRGSPTITSINCVQDMTGNAADEMLINVWNLRCMRGETFAGGDAPLIEASISQGDGRVEGTIANRSPHTLTDVRIRTAGGEAIVCGQGQSAITGSATTQGAADRDRIPPGATVAFSALVAAAAPASSHSAPQYYGPYGPGGAAYSGPMISVAGDLARGRSERIEELIRGGGWACVYAEAAPAEAAVPLEGNKKPIEKHSLVVRALVELK